MHVPITTYVDEAKSPDKLRERIHHFMIEHDYPRDQHNGFLAIKDWLESLDIRKTPDQERLDEERDEEILREIFPERSIEETTEEPLIEDISPPTDEDSPPPTPSSSIRSIRYVGYFTYPIG
jgi:hypothetical protein